MLVFVTDQPSGSLSGAEIFGIVCGMLALLDIIFGVGAGLYILTKSEQIKLLESVDDEVCGLFEVTPLELIDFVIVNFQHIIWSKTKQKHIKKLEGRDSSSGRASD